MRSSGFVGSVRAVCVGLVLLAGCRPAPTEPPPKSASPEPADTIAVEETVSVEDILAASDLPTVQEAPVAADPLGATVHRLSNGMTVYIATDRQAPSFYGWIAVRAGSRHDPPDSTGLAHYLEHMLLFKGSQGLGTVDHASERPHLKRIRVLYDELAEAPEADRQRILGEIDAETQQVAATAVPNEISRLYASLGVMYINAFTNKDRTVYVQRVPTNRFAAWAKVEVERFSRPVFRLFYPELEAVYEEKNRGLDSAWRPLWTLSNEGLFPEHPLGRQTTLGSVEHLKTPAFGNMVAFFERWYVPNNMAIVLAGDVDASVLPALEEAFGGMKPQALPESLPGSLPRVKGRIAKEFVSREEEVVEVSWRTTEAEHEDRAALAVLATLISDTDTGLLTTQLERPAKVQWAYGDATQYREAGSFSVLASPVPGQSLEDLEALVRKTVASIGTVTDAQVEAAKLDLEVQRAMDAESPYASVRRLVDAFVRHRDWSDVVAQDEAVKSVTRADVLAVAERYLGEDSVVVFRRRGEPELPKISKPEITPLDLDASRESAMAKEIKQMPAPPLTPAWVEAGTHYEERSIPSGRLIATKFDRNDVFRLTYAWRRGTHDAAALCFALDVQARSGSQERSADELQAALYALGAEVGFSCGSTESSIRVRGLDRNLEATLAVLDEWFGRANIGKEELAKHLAVELEARRNRVAREDTLADALREHARHGKRSAWKEPLSNRALKKLSPRQVQRVVEGVFDHQHDVLYSGRRSADDIAGLVARGTRHKKTTPFPKRSIDRREGVHVWVLHREQAKATVKVELPGAPVREETRPLHELFGSYLSGIGGIAFREIRTKRSLAYAVSAGVSDGRPGDDTILWGSMQNQSDKVAEAVPQMLDVLRTEGLEPERFGEARQGVLERYRGARVSPRSVPYVVHDWHHAAYTQDPRPARMKGAEAASIEVVGKEAATLSQGPVMVIIVGDTNAIDMASLRKLGTVHEMKADDLFSY